jgi:ribosomal protein L12E/L44/L45/RPP1/RPP2
LTTSLEPQFRQHIGADGPDPEPAAAAAADDDDEEEEEEEEEEVESSWFGW